MSPLAEAARPLFLDPPLAARKPDRAAPNHVVVLGYGIAGPAVLRHALTLAQDAAAAGPAITIFAPAPETAPDPLLAPGAVPGFVADVAVLAWDEAAALPPGLEAALEGKPPVNLWCVCRDDGLVTALALTRLAASRAWPPATIAVHQEQQSPPLPAGLRAFGAAPRNLATHDDALARHMHEAYLEGLRRQGAQTGSPASWDDLPETLRAANRAAAAHVAVKLAAIGCIEAAGRGDFAFTPAELEALAAIEHRRWCADRIVQGWRHGARRDNAARLHPDLVPYAALDAGGQQKDRDAVLALPGLLARMGRHIERLPETAA